MPDKKLSIPKPAAFKPEYIVQLPSQRGTSNGVKLRRPDLLKLVDENGDVPDLLSNIVMQGTGGVDMSNPEAVKNRFPDMLKSMRVIAKAAFVEPKLWDKDDADDEHMPVSWLDLNDLGFVLSWALGGEFDAAKSFPEQQS